MCLYHSPITRDTGPLSAEDRVRSLGKRVGFSEASLPDGEGRLYASPTSNLLVFERTLEPTSQSSRGKAASLQ